VINEIANQIFNSDARIVDVGQPNDQIPEILLWRSRDDGTRYSRSKVKYDVHFLFSSPVPGHTTCAPLESAWEFQIGHFECVEQWIYQVSPSTALPFRLRTRETGANGGFCSTGAPGVAGSCLAAVPHAPIAAVGER
jgi:hypothetical protein